ncbi:type II secretion system protein GspL [Variovorax sp. ZT5P49]|uniref:type II secretion system protein GspL n=1 Tax=Variovorax sp. ZT5P49 TaxID=3443733 RepID=UPI003F4618BE
MTTPVGLLRLMLPPARNMDASPVRCAWRTPQGVWHGAAFEGLAAIAARFQPKRVEVCPHPADVSMTQIELPPLPARRQRIAVLGAIELLTLAPPKNLSVAFGPRSEKGTVPVAWMSTGALSTCLRALQDQGLPVHAVFPPPAFLPAPVDDTSGAIVVDDWAVVRTGVDEGTLHPVPAGHANPSQIGERLQPFLPDSLQLRWLQLDETLEPGEGPASSPWTGDGWSWTLPTGKTSAEGADRRWLRPAIGWAVAATAVWLVGLNLYASQLAAQGQALTRQMAAQVKAAFPEVPVILNPLQQARQLRDARRTGAGAGTVASADFAALVRASAGLLTQAEGQVQSLDFQNGQLQIRWREGFTPNPDELKSLQRRAQERGLEVQAEDKGLRIQVGATKKGEKGDELAPRAAAAPKAAASGAAR